MRVAVPAEITPGERRTALVPNAVGRLVQAGLDVVVESGAGRYVHAPDDAYAEAGADVQSGDVLAEADVVLHVRPLDGEQITRLRRGAVTIGFCEPTTGADRVRALADLAGRYVIVVLETRIRRGAKL